MELYWKIRSSLYADSLRYKLIQKIYVMYSNNCTQLEVYTVLMIRTCTAVGCNYYEFELLAARSYRMQSDRHVWRTLAADARRGRGNALASWSPSVRCVVVAVSCGHLPLQ